MLNSLCPTELADAGEAAQRCWEVKRKGNLRGGLEGPMGCSSPSRHRGVARDLSAISWPPVNNRQRTGPESGAWMLPCPASPTRFSGSCVHGRMFRIVI
jgi:hypothetical protein